MIQQISAIFDPDYFSQNIGTPSRLNFTKTQSANRVPFEVCLLVVTSQESGK